jgi:hypothetical protein
VGPVSFLEGTLVGGDPPFDLVLVVGGVRQRDRDLSRVQAELIGRALHALRRRRGSGRRAAVLGCVRTPLSLSTSVG